jgi:hypothetical protein
VENALADDPDIGNEGNEAASQQLRRRAGVGLDSRLEETLLAFGLANSKPRSDFLTVETTFLRRLYVFLHLADDLPARVHCLHLKSERRPGRPAVRTLVMQPRKVPPFPLLIHDRDKTFSRAFDEVFRPKRIKVIRTPTWARHCSERRPHQAFRLLPPDGCDPTSPRSAVATRSVQRHDLLGGLIHEYGAAV